jgi:hypothetical protein
MMQSLPRSTPNVRLRLIDQSQKMTVTAIPMAEEKVSADRSIAGVDAAPVLEFGKHVFDAVALAIVSIGVRTGPLSGQDRRPKGPLWACDDDLAVTMLGCACRARGGVRA